MVSDERLHFNAPFIKGIKSGIHHWKALGLPIGRGGVNFIVHLITWLKILRFEIPFPTPVGMLDIVSWPKSKPKSEFLHTNVPLLLQPNILLDGLSWKYSIFLLSAPQAGDVTALPKQYSEWHSASPSEPLPGTPVRCRLVACGSPNSTRPLPQFYGQREPKRPWGAKAGCS